MEVFFWIFHGFTLRFEHNFKELSQCKIFFENSLRYCSIRSLRITAGFKRKDKIFNHICMIGKNQMIFKTYSASSILLFIRIHSWYAMKSVSFEHKAGFSWFACYISADIRIIKCVLLTCDRSILSNRPQFWNISDCSCFSVHVENNRWRVLK